MTNEEAKAIVAKWSDEGVLVSDSVIEILEAQPADNWTVDCSFLINPFQAFYAKLTAQIVCQLIETTEWHPGSGVKETARLVEAAAMLAHDIVWASD